MTTNSSADMTNHFKLPSLASHTSTCVRRTLRFAALLTLAGAAVGQTTWYVDASAPAPGNGSLATPFRSIAFAVAQPAVSTGDTLSIAPGTYHEKVSLGSKGLRLRSSAGPLVTALEASEHGSVIDSPTFGPLVEIEGLTIRGSALLESNGVAGGNVIVRGCILTGHRPGNNTSFTGAGVLCKFDARIERCTVYDNSLGFAVLPTGVALISDSIFASNALGDGDLGSAQANYTLWDAPPSVFLGTINGDPLFWDAAGGDVALRPGSPCIDRGNPNAPLDPDGTRRDMGAVGFDSNYAPAPQVYCTSKLNSLGCTPAIGASGVASATSASPFTIFCQQQVSQRQGLLFYGFEPNALSFQGGWLCVKPPHRRTAVQNSGGSPGGGDCTGAFTFDFNARIQAGVDPSLVAGVTVYAQYWSRDPGASFNVHRSDAVRFGVAP